MGAVLELDAVLRDARVWRGRAGPASMPGPASQPTGHAPLDAVLPGGGWPPAALSELLLASDGIGELALLWPTLARLTGNHETVALIAPPYLPYPGAWQAAGVVLDRLPVIAVRETREALWAAEQILRAGCCAAVVCWLHSANDRALRRLAVAAASGRTLGFVLRPATAAANPSPAALRVALDARPARLRVLKCRGGLPPTAPIPLPVPAQH